MFGLLDRSEGGIVKADALDDLLLFVLVAGVDLALGQPRMRHVDPAIDARVLAVIERWHAETEPPLPSDAIPGWLLSLPRWGVPEEESAND